MRNTITDTQSQRSLRYYQEYGAKEDAIRLVFDGQEPDGQFHSEYRLDELPEPAMQMGGMNL